MTVLAAIRGGAGSDTLDLDIYDDIGGGGGLFGPQGISAQDIRRTLKENRGVKKINVRINSAGGEVVDGTAIYNLLAAHPAHVRVQIDALAASIASIIAMAGDEIVMAEGAFMMIHNPFAMTAGESGDLRKMADNLDKMRANMIAIYAARTGQDPEDIGAAMDAETWMTAKEAKALGYATAITPAKKGNAAKAAAWNLGAFARVPDAVTKLAQIQQGAAMAEEDKSKASESVEDRLAKMEKKCADLEAQLAEFKKKDDDGDDGDDGGDDADAKADDGDKKEPAKSKSDDGEDGEMAKAAAASKVLAAVMNITGVSDIKAMVDALGGLVEANASMKSRIAALEATEHASKVSAAIASGKLLPAQKEWALKLGAKGFASYLDALGAAVVGPAGKTHELPKDAPKASGEDVTLTAEEIKMCQQFGNDPAAFLAAKKLRVAAGGK